jgi:sucrose phosphorylase
MTLEQHRTGPTGARGPQLIVYADRFGGTLKAVGELMSTRLAGLFSGVHVLPFYTPFDGADAGFDPVDHMEVDPRLGTWDDIASLSADMTVVADLIVNHMSVASPQFEDFRAHGDSSPWAPLFLTMKHIFPKGATEEDLACIYRPRPGLPFTIMRLGGEARLVWTTFTPSQVDLDIRQPLTWSYLSGIIDRLTASGVSIIRLDAVGYTGKSAGTNCFMTRETLDFVLALSDYCHERGAKVLLEVHGHFSQQVEVARFADLVYDFALPPLVLHAIFASDPQPLAHWLAIRPQNTVTVLDTHDGIGIIDAGANVLRPSQPGLLDEEQIARLVDFIYATAPSSKLATGAAASNLDLYQVNCTFFDALGRDEGRYLLARALQLFVPGIPQVYYVGLMAGVNDLELFGQTRIGRDINRHRYSLSEIERQLSEPVVRAQTQLLKLYSRHPAFAGTFAHDASGSTIALRWRSHDDEVCLDADLARRSFYIRFRSGSESWSISSQELLSSRREGLRIER